MRGAARLEAYVLARTLGAVGAALALISAVILLVQFVALSRSIGVRADVSASAAPTAPRVRAST
jgi:lipopolysaccharide export system permease protein